MRVRHLTVLLALTTGACERATGPETAPNGYLGVRLSGAVSGHYEAEGRYPRSSPAWGPATFAAAQPGVQPGTFSIGGWRARAEARQDMVGVNVKNVSGPGVYPADGIVHVAEGGTASPSRSFLITSGEVELISTSGERFQGRFSATAVEMVPPLGPAPDTLRLADGIFDVPIIRP